MISPRNNSHHSKNKIPSSKSIKLPDIPSRNRLQSGNKKSNNHELLPKIPLPLHGQNKVRKLSIGKNKENSSDNHLVNNILN